MDTQNNTDDDFDFDSSPPLDTTKPKVEKEKPEPKSSENKPNTKLISIISIVLIVLSITAYYLFFNNSKGSSKNSQNIELTEVQLVQFDKIMNDIFIGEYVGITNNNDDTASNGKECRLFASQLIRGTIENGVINYTLKGNFKVAEIDVSLNHFNIATATAKTALLDGGKSLSNITMYLKSTNGHELKLEFENRKSFKAVLNIEKENKFITAFATKLNNPDYEFILDHQLIGNWKGEINGQQATLILKPYFMHFSEEKWGLSSDCNILMSDGGNISFGGGNIIWKKLGDNFTGTITFKTNEDREIYIYEAELTGTIADCILRAEIKGKYHNTNDTSQLNFNFYK